MRHSTGFKPVLGIKFNQLDEISKIDQASTQWTLATLFVLLEKDFSPEQKEKATTIMKDNLAHHTDWIVLNTTMDSLAKWAKVPSLLNRKSKFANTVKPHEKEETELAQWMLPHLKRLSEDSRNSVAKKANKTLEQLNLK